MKIDPKNMTSEAKIMQNNATLFKTTGPTGIFWEIRDITTVSENYMLKILERQKSFSPRKKER